MTDVMACRVRACWYERQLETMIELLDGERPLSGSKKDQLQAMMRELKERFEDDDKVARPARRTEELSRVEQDYHHAVREASTRILVPSNSTPDGWWLHDLYSCRVDIRHYLAHSLPQD